MTQDPQPIHAIVGALQRDVFLYNGPIQRFADLNVVELIGASKRSSEATLLLVTNGGDPDAAFKIGRYLQEKYERYTVLIPGLCKSAGTLLAVGAYEIAFTPYGELGPLDIQMSKVDRFEQAQSGLVISDSLNTLESRAMEIFRTTTSDLMTANQGMISFATASQAAVDAMKAIYGPVLARIDPEEIGVRSRAMRIAQDYGSRLAAKSRNLKPDALRLLAETYSSHSFVIDKSEAENLFERVRSATDVEMKVIAMLGRLARFQGNDLSFHALHQTAQPASEEATDAEPATQEPTTGNGGNSEASDGAPVPETASVIHHLQFGHGGGSTIV